MTRWFDDVDRLLYDGEAIEETVALGDGGVVVTSHRVLAFTPESDGANFTHVERPNVIGVARAARGRSGLLGVGVKAGVVGAVLLAAGLTISLDGLVGGIDLGSGTGQLGMGGMLSMLQTMLGLLALLDDALRVGGALALLAGLAALAAYAYSRETIVRLSVAGGEDVALALRADDADADAVQRIERAVVPGEGAESDTATGPGART